MAVTINKNYKAKTVSYGGSRSASQIKYLVFHYTGNTTDKAVSNAKYFATTNTREAGAHYFVDDTSVYQSVDDLKVAWAVGGSIKSKANGAASMYGKITNNNSISIELCSTNGQITLYTIDKALNLAVELMKKYNIPMSNVYRHWDVNGKACPGWNGWIGTNQSTWNAVKEELNKRYTGTKTNTTVTPTPTTTSSGKANVYYQVITAAGKNYSEVKNNSDYAGVHNQSVTKVAVRVDKGTIHYQVHVKGGSWLPYVTGYNWWDNNNGYAGNGKIIDGFRAYGENLGGKLKYQVSTNGSGTFLPAVTEATDYAGVLGRAIDCIKMWVE